MSNKIVAHFGDINPIEYGGGVIFQTEYGYTMEYTHGLETEGETEERMTVYRCDVEDNVFEYHNWADLKSIASCLGSTVGELQSCGTSDKVETRAYATECIASYYGWYELDQYPITLTQKELEERWELE